MAARIVGVVKTLRNNWKKSIFFAGVLTWGTKFGIHKYDEEQTRRRCCSEALAYGSQKILPGEKPKKVTVFLNPTANNGKARKLFDKNVAPLLHLAGYEVGIVRTEYEGQAKKYMDYIENADFLIVAGGDGTLLEVITGLLRKTNKDYAKKLPIGIIPLGSTNSFASIMFGRHSNKEIVKWLTDSTMAVIKGNTKPVDVMQIKGGTEEENKTVYSLSGIEWGSYHETEVDLNRYWILGPLRYRFTYLLSVLYEWPKTVAASVSYTNPCSGCSKCKPIPQWRWWHILYKPAMEDFSKIINEDCGVQYSKELQGSQITVRSSNYKTSQRKHAVEISTSPVVGKIDYLKEGFTRLQNDRKSYETNETGGELLEAGSFTLEPQLNESEESSYFIDNEKFEAMPLDVQVLKDKIKFFCNPSS